MELRTIQAAFDGVGEPCHVLPLQGEAAIYITQRGGRVLGLFPTLDGPNLLWSNREALANSAALQAFAAAGGWNLGGERIWIAPEIQYIIQDRRDFWGTHRLPPAIDPGGYALSVGDDGGVELAQTITLRAYNLAQGEKSLDIRRRLYAIDDPLRALSSHAALTEGVQYIGYAQSVTLSETDDVPITSESWNLVQLNAGGTLFIATTGITEASDYFGSVPDEARTLHDGSHLRLSITGKRQYKVGYKAASMTGRMAYLNALPDGRSYLLVRDFDNDPSAAYTEEPPDAPGNRGHSVHVYNDGGEMGGFGEMECSGRAIGGGTGRTTSTDAFRLWAYVGVRERLTAILHALTGVRA